MSESQPTNCTKPSVPLNRVVLIGCEQVSGANVYSLLAGDDGAVREFVLVGEGNNRLLGEVMDLQHAVPLVDSARVWAGDYPEAGQADIAVICAGIDSLLLPGGENRLDWLDGNVRLIREITRKLMSSGFEGIILMTTNPVDVLAQIALEESGFPAHKIIGSGEAFGATLAEELLGEELSVEASLIRAYMAGERRSSNPEVATWCAAAGGPGAAPPLVDFCQPNCFGFDKMLECVRLAAAAAKEETVPRKGFNYSTVGSCVTRICEAILLDERAILPVSVMTSGQYGISDVYLNLPCVVGRNGAEQIVELPLSQTEREDLQASADALRATLKIIKETEAYPAAKS